MHIGLKIFIWGVLGLVVFGALLFGPAGTFDYWQAWVFLAAFVSTTIGPTIYLARNDPRPFNVACAAVRSRRAERFRSSSSSALFWGSSR